MPKASEASTSSAKSGAGGRKPYSRGRDGDPGGKGGRGGHQGGRRRPAPGAAAEVGGGGVSKIKASLRQTKRLLAKDNLAPDVRQEAERRLISLEQDLELKQSSEHDRKNAERYHKVRFFERQKLVRQIKKIKKSLPEADSREAKKLNKELKEKRILLNYVLNFPTKYKYVALFPSNGESPFTAPDSVAEETETSRRAAKTHDQAQEVRRKVIEAMERGDLSTEPEEELEQRDGTTKRIRLDLEHADENDRADSQEAVVPAAATTDKKSKKSKTADKKSKKSSSKESAKITGGGVQDDDFFASDDE
ncbi:unnamed protein product [Sympodiomycopsis kandeliae]